YPMDTNCSCASSSSELCVQSDTVIVATTAQITGTTVGQAADFRPPAGTFNGQACSTSGTATSPDVAVQIDVPAIETLSLTLNPVSYDSTHVLLNSTCGGTPIECYDSPTGMVFGNFAAGRYYL